MNTLTRNRRPRDIYFKLVRAFPLRPIRDQEEYEQAGKVLNRLLGRQSGKLAADERDYLDALVLLVEDYDRKHLHLPHVRQTPAEALRFLTKQSGIGPTALGKILGTTHALASLMLHGKRGISAQAARKLAEYFKVETSLFV